MTNDDLGDSQGDLLPFASPEAVLAMLRRQERRVLAISPELSKRRSLLLLAEGALFDLCLDGIEREVLESPEYKARQEFQASHVLESLKQSIPLRRRRRGAASIGTLSWLVAGAGAAAMLVALIL